jgi:putative spermidine/putrescine transport system permease protein
MKKFPFWSWLWVILGVLYFFLPLLGTLEFSLRIRRDAYTLDAYQIVLSDPKFQQTFTFSIMMALATIVFSILLVAPTLYWVHLKLPQLRPAVEFATLLPFVVPAVVLVFGYLRIYGTGSPLGLPLTGSEQTTNLLLIFAYTVLALPYVFRSVDAGLRAIDIRTLTEAGQSLGANWFTIMFQIIFPNLRVALLSSAFLTFAICVGEYTFASLLDRPAFGPYLQLIGANKAYEPSALAIISFSLTWACVGVLQFLGRGQQGQSQISGAR